MLAKLLKHDFLISGRLLLPILGGGCALGLGVTLYSMAQTYSAAALAGGLLLNFLLTLLGFVTQILTLVFVISAINRSLFGAQGHLTFSLPSSTMATLFSKSVTGFLFLLLGAGVTAGLSLAAMTNIRRIILTAGEEVMNGMGLQEAQADLMGQMFSFASFEDIVRFAGIFFVLIFAYILLIMSIVIFVITLSHVRPFQQKSGFWMVVFLTTILVASFVLLNYASDAMALRVVLPLFSTAMMENATEAEINLTQIMFAIGLSVGFFFLTNYFLKRKISLK
jgi:hypothetical protein